MADFTNSGYIAKTKKRDTEKSPHWRGRLNVEGVEFDVSCWEKNDGLFSVKVTKAKPKDEDGDEPPP